MNYREKIRKGSGNTGMKLKFFALLTPVSRIYDAPDWGHAAAIVGAAFSYLVADVFTSALFLIVFSGTVDYFLGVRWAKIKSEYDSETAHAGFVSKISGVLIMLLVRAFEYWLMKQGLLNSHGMASAFLTISLFAVDLESIQSKREEMGAKPIPALGWLTTKIQSTIRGAIDGAEITQHAHSRHDDPKPGDV